MNNNNKNVRVIGNPAVINHQRPVNLMQRPQRPVNLMQRPQRPVNLERMPRPQISHEQIKQMMDRLKKKK